jgi:phage terminase small subunit
MAKTVDDGHDLTDLQRRFCDEYLKDLNATKAYRRAGYSCKNENAAASSAATLLRNPKIKAYLGAVANMTQPKIINEAFKLAFASIGDAIEVKRGEAVLRDDISADTMAAISSLESIPILGADGEIVGTRHKVSMHSKQVALNLLMKKFNMFPAAEMPLAQALQVLSAEGILPPEAAEIVASGIDDIKAKLSQAFGNGSGITKE